MLGTRVHKAVCGLASATAHHRVARDRVESAIAIIALFA
jgi:hypothetical protein